VSLSNDKKLTIIYRIEPGCLGPQGSEHIQAFCVFAQKEFDALNMNYAQWKIVPRENKALPEVEYQLKGKRMAKDKTERFLQIFDENLSDFEQHMDQTLAQLIDDYLGR